jgi:protein-disulfide isomerase
MRASVMPTSQRISPKNVFLGISLLLCVVGFGLSLASWYHVCSTACAEGHNYRLFGLPFEGVGVLFFIATAVTYVLTIQWQKLDFLPPLLVAGAVGAETRFLLFQKFIIGKWCPLCVAIAGCVLALAIVCLSQYVIHLRSAVQKQDRRQIMVKIWKGMGAWAVGVLGFFIAFAGIARLEHSFAEPNARGESPVFGKKNTSVEVFFFSDWFCPACRKAEPELEKQYAAIIQNASMIFVDVPLHEDSLNFLPYNLSFMMKEKDKYLELRRALTELAAQNSSPTNKDVEALANKLGVKYHQLEFAEVNQGLTYFKKLAKQFRVDSTPTLVVYNPKTKKKKTLVGVKQIGEADIPKIVERLRSK